jgi:hypothetical protein
LFPFVGRIGSIKFWVKELHMEVRAFIAPFYLPYWA